MLLSFLRIVWFLSFSAPSDVPAAPVTADPVNYSQLLTNIYSEYLHSGEISRALKLHYKDFMQVFPALPFVSKLQLFFKLHLTSGTVSWSASEREEAKSMFDMIGTDTTLITRLWEVREDPKAGIPRTVLTRLAAIKEWLPKPTTYGHKVKLALIQCENAMVRRGATWAGYDEYLLAERLYPSSEDRICPQLDRHMIALLLEDNMDPTYAGLMEKQGHGAEDLKMVGFFNAALTKSERRRLFVVCLKEIRVRDCMRAISLLPCIRKELFPDFFSIALEQSDLRILAALLTCSDPFESYPYVCLLSDQSLASLCALFKSNARAKEFFVGWHNLAVHYAGKPSERLAKCLVESKCVEPGLKAEFACVSVDMESAPLTDDALLFILHMAIHSDLYIWTSVKLVCQRWNALLDVDGVVEVDDRFRDRFIYNCMNAMPPVWKLIVRRDQARQRLLKHALAHRKFTCWPHAKPLTPNGQKLDTNYTPFQSPHEQDVFLYNYQLVNKHLPPFPHDILSFTPHAILSSIPKLLDEWHHLPNVDTMAALIDSVIMPYYADYETAVNILAGRYGAGELLLAVLRRYLIGGCHQKTVQCILTAADIEPTYVGFVKLSQRQSGILDYLAVPLLFVKEVVAGRGDVFVVAEKEIVDKLEGIMDAIYELHCTLPEFEVIVEYLQCKCPGLGMEKFVVAMATRFLAKEHF